MGLDMGRERVHHEKREKLWRELREIGTASTEQVSQFFRNITGAKGVDSPEWKELTRNCPLAIPVPYYSFGIWSYRGGLIGEADIDSEGGSREAVHVINPDTCESVHYESTSGSIVAVNNIGHGRWQVYVQGLSQKSNGLTVQRIEKLLGVNVPEEYIEPLES